PTMRALPGSHLRRRPTNIWGGPPRRRKLTWETELDVAETEPLHHRGVEDREPPSYEVVQGVQNYDHRQQQGRPNHPPSIDRSLFVIHIRQFRQPTLPDSALHPIKH
ncbi:MAG: hypothetical protein JRI56_08920, partial [Deltaproteobacteria bacterium]|nr:hypothetical protein [Deltaproteobacteria bacterium]